MNSLNFNNVSILGYSHTPKFFGEDIFNYSMEKTFSVQGYLLDLQNFDGVSGTISGIEDIKKLAKENGKFYINNEFLGTGYINNIKVDGSDNDPNWVRYANYVADVTILTTGSLYNLTGEFYDLDTLKFNVNNLYLLNDFKENFSVNLVEQGIYEYTHEVSFEFENGINKSEAQNTAKILASGIISKEVPFETLSIYNNFLSGKKLYKESYDIINNKFTFVETFQKSKSGDYADSLYNYEINLNPEGDVTVVENIKIKSLMIPYFQKSIEKLDILKSNAYSRCQQIYNYYYGNTGSLNENYLEQGFAVNRFNGEIEFQSIFSNTEFRENGYEWELIAEAEDNEERFKASVSLTIEGFGPINSNQKWNNALMGFYAKSHMLTPSFASTAFQGLSRTSCGNVPLPNYLFNTRKENSYANGIIKVVQTWSDMLKKTSSSTSDQPPLKQYNFITSANIVTENIAKTIGRGGQSKRVLGSLNDQFSYSPENFFLPSDVLVESEENSYDYINHITESKISYIY